MPFGLCNAPSAFQRLMEHFLRGLNPEEGPDFVDAYIDDVLLFSQTLNEHLHHLSLILNVIKKAGLKLKFSKCKFFQKEVEFLGDIITTKGLKPTLQQRRTFRPHKHQGYTAVCRTCVVLQTIHSKRRQDSAFASCPDEEGSTFSLDEGVPRSVYIAETQVVLSPRPDFCKDFILETDASIKGLGTVLSEQQSDGKLHPIAFASRALSLPEKNYAVTELETPTVVWACSHFHTCLYGHNVTVYNDHSAVKAILETPSPSGKHACWWSKVYGSGLKSVQIIYLAGRDKKNADALSRNPQLPATTEDMADTDVQVAVVSTSHMHDLDVSTLLRMESGQPVPSELTMEQRKDQKRIKRAKAVAAQASVLTLVDNILYYVHSKQGDRRQTVVREHLRRQIMEDNLSGPMAGHFSGNRPYNILVQH